MMPRTLIYEPLDDVISDISHADLLLFSGSYLSSEVIKAAGRSDYSHAGAVLWIDDIPLSAEATPGGVKIYYLPTRVRDYRGRIDWFRANANERWPEFSRMGTGRHLLKLMGNSYGFRGFAKMVLLHMPLFRWFVRPNFNDDDQFDPNPICSEAVAAAYYFGGGVDPVPKLSSRYTEPGDLARSPFFKYACSLEP